MSCFFVFGGWTSEKIFPVVTYIKTVVNGNNKEWNFKDTWKCGKMPEANKLYRLYRSVVEITEFVDWFQFDHHWNSGNTKRLFHLKCITL